MKMTIKAGELAKALSVHKGDPRGSVPALRCAKIDATGGTIETTNMEISATIRVNIQGAGAILLPIEQTLGFASRMPPDADIAIEADDLAAKLACGRSRATMELMDVADFPTMRASAGKVETISIDAATFSAMVDRVEDFVSKNQTQFSMCGVYMEAVDGHLLMTATHGGALANYSLPIDHKEKRQVIIPTETLDVIHKMGKSGGVMTVSVAENLIGFEVGPIAVRSKIIDGTYPEYRRSMVLSGDRVEFKAADMKAAIALIQASSDADRHAIRLSISADEITISGVDGKSRAETTIGCATETWGDAFVVGVNYDYLLSAISPIADAAVLLIGAGRDPVAPFGLLDADDDGVRVTIATMRV